MLSQLFLVLFLLFVSSVGVGAFLASLVRRF